MAQVGEKDLLHLALPKGRMQAGVFSLLSDAGIRVVGEERGYRPAVSVPGFEVKVLKPQNIVEMLHAGSRDAGLAGADWVAELNIDLVELLDTGLDPVRIVAAAPAALLKNGKLPRRRVVVASEYERLTMAWMAKRKLRAAFVRSYGATEVFPPEDADCIVDVAQSGATLRANGLVVVDELMTSSTRLYANPAAMDDPSKKERLEGLVLLLRSVLEARHRVMLEVNVPPEKLESVIAILPCMREPTISTLHGGAGYAVKVAAPRKDLPRLIPEIKKRGGTDVVVTALTQIVP
ncbi:MAG: ATP phosphoribosyltransferase [Deltaproteobacteria bacterium]|nr:ATP phosphoribosyltransferase [Deltaproteobacteria bacterium]